MEESTNPFLAASNHQNAGDKRTLRVAINDGSRHTELTGYGNLSRAIILALREYSPYEISVAARQKAIPEWVRRREELDAVPILDADKPYACELRISSPPSRFHPSKPTVIYTQNALSHLLPAQISAMKNAEGIIVPSEFDAKVFRRHIDNVFVCHQYVDDIVFDYSPRAEMRESDTIKFLFVGSYGFRKGVDTLLKAFSKAFDDGRKVSLTMVCYSGLENDSPNHLIELARDLPTNVGLSVLNGSVIPEELATIYNQHDCVVSFSRGEGWCMPLHEALLCQKPIIAPNSTSMGESLPDIGSIKVETKATLISEISDPFGASFKKRYGVDGNMMYEVCLDDAVNALREMYANYGDYSKNASEARELIQKKYSLKSLARKISTSLAKLGFE